MMTGIAASLLTPRQFAARADEIAAPKWLSAAEIDGSYAAVEIDRELNSNLLATSGVRLHAVEAAPQGHLAVAVARRPGTVSLVIDRRTAQSVGRFFPEPGRVFSGHGRFTPDGRRFFVAEIDADTGAGTITVRDTAKEFAVIGAWSTAGGGPHDLLQFDTTLFVANGGIEPGSPEAATADSADASIALVDTAAGTVKQRLMLPHDLRGQSLRHLVVGPSGEAIAAAQELAPEGAARPLLYRAAGDALVPYEAEEEVLAGFKGYVGSVAIDSSGNYVAAASPRGGCVAVWSLDGRYVGSTRLIDGCGLAAAGPPGHLVATSGLGEAVMLVASREGLAVAERRHRMPRFDNHVSMSNS
jgi:hypothetical protein